MFNTRFGYNMKMGRLQYLLYCSPHSSRVHLVLRSAGSLVLLHPRHLACFFEHLSHPHIVTVHPSISLPFFFPSEPLPSTSRAAESVSEKGSRSQQARAKQEPGLGSSFILSYSRKFCFRSNER
ncbi:unnamed protein product [Orchesella dallaii]|uniref:Uncharacterized protein n=1 Tax=Orchesella dallaii TaxID=48710 RepID=A0ABP1PJT1_9HEXA